MRTLARLSLAAALALSVRTGPAGAAGPAAPADDLATAVARMARIGSRSSPSFSPAARQLAFVSNLAGVPQVWTVAAAGGWPQPVTALDDQVGSVAWSPDGGWLAFALAPGGGMNQQVYLVRPDGRDLRRLTAGGKDNNWLSGFTHDGRGLAFSSNRAGGGMDGYLWDLSSGEARLVARNSGTGTVTDVCRDGGRAVVRRVVSRSDSNLFLVDFASGRETLLTAHPPPGELDGGVLSPDGGTVYLASDVGRDLAAFARVRVGAEG